MQNQEQSFKSNSAVAETTIKNGSDVNTGSQKNKPENMTSQVTPLLFIEVIYQIPKMILQLKSSIVLKNPKNVLTSQ